MTWPAVKSVVGESQLSWVPYMSSSPYSICDAAGAPVPNELDELLAWFEKQAFRVYWTNNPWSEPPEAIVERGVLAVKDYFMALFDEGRTVKRTSVKVVLVGQEGAGKTR